MNGQELGTPSAKNNSEDKQEGSTKVSPFYCQVVDDWDLHFDVSPHKSTKEVPRSLALLMSCF